MGRLLVSGIGTDANFEWGTRGSGHDSIPWIGKPNRRILGVGLYTGPQIPTTRLSIIPGPDPIESQL